MRGHARSIRGKTMKRFIWLAILLPLVSYADPDLETFATCAAGSPIQDCLHINEANARFVVLEDQADALETQAAALGALIASVEAQVDTLEAQVAALSTVTGPWRQMPSVFDALGERRQWYNSSRDSRLECRDRSTAPVVVLTIQNDAQASVLSYSITALPAAFPGTAADLCDAWITYWLTGQVMPVS